MSSNSTILARLAFNAIDQETMATLREWKSFILDALPLSLTGSTITSRNSERPRPFSRAAST